MPKTSHTDLEIKYYQGNKIPLIFLSAYSRTHSTMLLDYIISSLQYMIVLFHFGGTPDSVQRPRSNSNQTWDPVYSKHAPSPCEHIFESSFHSIYSYLPFSELR